MTLFQSFLFVLGIIVTGFLFFASPSIIAHYISMFFDIPEHKNTIAACIMLSDCFFIIVYCVWGISNKNKK